MKIRYIILLFMINMIHVMANGSVDGNEKPLSQGSFLLLLIFIILCLALLYFLLERYIPGVITLKKYSVITSIVIIINSIGIIYLYVEVWIMEKTEEGMWLSKAEYEELTEQINNFSNSQRLSSVILWIGLVMIILHIAADIVFHIWSLELFKYKITIFWYCCGWYHKVKNSLLNI